MFLPPWTASSLPVDKGTAAEAEARWQPLSTL